MGGGGIIIINQAQLIRDALLDPAFASGFSESEAQCADTLCAKALAEWTKADCVEGLIILARTVTRGS